MQRGCPKHFEVARNDGEDILGNLRKLGRVCCVSAKFLNFLKFTIKNCVSHKFGTHNFFVSEADAKRALSMRCISSQNSYNKSYFTPPQGWCFLLAARQRK